MCLLFVQELIRLLATVWILTDSQFNSRQRFIFYSPCHHLKFNPIADLTDEEFDMVIEYFCSSEVLEILFLEHSFVPQNCHKEELFVCSSPVGVHGPLAPNSVFLGCEGRSCYTFPVFLSLLAQPATTDRGWGHKKSTLDEERHHVGSKSVGSQTNRVWYAYTVSGRGLSRQKVGSVYANMVSCFIIPIFHERQE